MLTPTLSVKEASLGRAVMTLKLEAPSVIQYLDILNAGSAFVQVTQLS